MDWLDTIIYENFIRDWLIALGILIAAYIGLLLVLRLVVHRLSRFSEKTDNDIDDFLADFIKRTKFYFLLAVSIYIASLSLDLSSQAQLTIRTVMVITTLIQAGFWGISVIDYLVQKRVNDDLEEQPSDTTTLNAFGLVLKIALWVILVLLMLENVTGVQVDSLIASLGIGGIAVALAVQNILGDLFSALTIALDKPFVIGDFINVDDFTGAVEYVGLKSTRVRSLTGEQLVFSNSDLLSSRIRNYKRMERRRIAFNIGVTYQTEAEKLAAIPDMVRKIIEGRPDVTYDRTHLRSFGDFAILFEVVFFMENPDFNLYVDTQQEINLEIYKQFGEEGIEFAYPTQTVFVEKTA